MGRVGWRRRQREVSKVYLSSDDRTRLTHWCTMHTAYIVSKVGISGCPMSF